MSNDQARRNRLRLLLINRRFVVKIALIVGVVSCLGILLALIFITGGSNGEYGAASRHYSLNQRYLSPMLLAAWLVLALLFGVITWMISLYTSHCVAGPLYRFARNIETFIRQGPVTPVPTRRTDRLKHEEQQIKRSVARLQQHYGEMHAVAGKALSQPDARAAAIARLKELDREARL